MKYDIVSLGELLIDFTNNGFSAQGNVMFEANPGGGVANCLAMVSKLGRKTALITRVGDDFLGHHLAGVLEEAGIDSGFLSYDEKIPTTLAFVHTGEGGERSFSFYRNPGADLMLEKEHFPKEVLENTRIFHLGTLSMTEDKIFETTKFAIEVAKRAGVLISLDPNYRDSLWDSEERAKEKIWYGIENCDILKISDNEIEFITGEKDIDKGISLIRKRTAAKLLLATLGPEGSLGYYGDIKVFAEPFVLGNTIETTGAGDTFTGSMLDAVLEYGIDGFNRERLYDSMRFANGAAALVTTKKVH